MDIEKNYNTILVVHLEDSNFISKFTNVFESKGFSLYHTSSIEQAYQHLGSHSVDIIVLDMDENYEEAFRFCYRIKHNKNFEHIFIIGLSAAHSKYDILINPQTREDLKWLNCNLFIHKPINAQNLYLLLKKEIAIMQGIDSTDLDSDSTSWL